MKRGVPPRGSIPGKNPRGKVSGDANLGNFLGIGGLLEGLFKGVGKTIESIQNLNLEDLEKLAEAQGNEKAKENIRELKKRMGKREEKGIRIGDLFGEGLDLSKLIEFAAKHGGEFSQKFAGGKGVVQGGIRGHIMGIPFGGKDLPLERSGAQDTKFEVRGTRPKRTPKTEKTMAPEEADLRELEIDPIEEEENCFKVRGYMAGVDKGNITCEVRENGTVLRISTCPPEPSAQADGRRAEERRRYEKEVTLPSPVIKKVNWSYINGVLEVTLTKKKSK
ncbi:MAG: hypothetical protein CO031_02490 [Candidatus Nealsonbacteria bacterium CG_4_9_14_0_2_um_filter_37_38]|nr:MAG: hypothetical protein COV63_02990 [Candidatus Nealsonbacteria bacterium CG11_big_fil_rev_8_21_14_0_20_37_68]PIW91893.1 MAG: hypothetical protein COZ89_02750 [Candidatus Nealsonbacteria bacterium CG_4_8_14_3_um_filter_37_23]PJC51496.1 MAG: hypothetical protein CO031_02490 [Candidatus Nealsonbacteria bacterium CG_4_9_14_0_2_um_filter_37_38]